MIKESTNHNKVDLIFEKQPPQVKRKLMNLLIQYNAVMQYNQDQDKFEVDLLLPFRDQSQKQQFVHNFMSRTNNKNTQQRQQLKNSQKDEINLREISEYHAQDPVVNESLIDSKNGGNRSDINSQKNYAHNFEGKQRKMSANLSNKAEKRSRKYSQKQSNIIERDEQLSLNFTNELQSNSKKQLSQIQFGINFSKISKLISHKLSHAIYKIKLKQQPHLNSIQDLDEGQFQSDIPKYQRQQFNQTSSKLELHNSHHDSGNSIHHTNLSHISNQILISDNGDEPEITEFSDKYHYAEKESSNYPQIKQQGIEEQQDPLQQRMSLQEYKRLQQKAKTKAIKQNLEKKYKNQKPSIKKSGTLRQKYSQFLKKNHKDISNLYDNIRRDMKRNDAKIHQIRSKDPILVLQNDIKDSNSEEDRAFNQQMIQQYKQHIVAQNQNMSSEDLIRYFRYLVHNARSLYIKHISKIK